MVGNLTKELIRLGMNKYRIAKAIGTNWNTVSFWEREVWKPSEKNQERLEKLVKEIKSGAYKV